MNVVSATSRHLRALCRSRHGNVAIVATLSLPILIGALALGVDWGYLGYQRRDAQADTDLAALSAASAIDAAPAAIEAFLAQNHIEARLRSESDFAEDAGAPTAEGVMTYVRGHYTPSEAIPPGERFTAGQAPFDAVRVRLYRRADLAFASMFSKPPTISTEAIAGIDGFAAISIGSRLASLDGGILNAVLGKLLGTQLDLSVMDYRALLDADVDVLSFLDAVATHLDLKAASYDYVLNSQLSVGKFLDILGGTSGLSRSVSQILARAAKEAARSDRSLDLSALFDLGSTGRRPPGSGGGLPITAGVLDILSAAGAIADGDHQIDLGVDAQVPGLADLSVSLLVGEPPIGSAWFAVGGTGTLVRTAQTRLKIDAAIGGKGLLSAARIDLPIYLELAYAEGRIISISCLGPSAEDAKVDVAVRPGIAEAWIGAVPHGDLGNLPDSGTAGVGYTHLVDVRLLGLSVDGFAHARIGDTDAETLHFWPNDIRGGRVQSVSTRSYAGSLVASLLGDLSLRVSALGLHISTPPALADALAATLSAAVEPLDNALYNILAALGIRLGEADVRVTGVSCGHPVLVQ